MTNPAASEVEIPGRQDFDFLRGSWTVLSRRLQNPLDPASEDWREFTMEATNEAILGGLGNIDRYRSTEFPGQPDFQAFALRLFDAGAGIWRIWWVSPASQGQLDTPVIGRFVDRHGLFECEDVLDGRRLHVRYEWLLDDELPRWQQAFSWDEGRTWRHNWFMEWRRA
jgi:hypothetical protein